MKQDYPKMKIALRAFLQGRGYFTALRAMEFAENLHNGIRKDGAPEFSHQVSQALYAVTLIDLLSHPEETIAVIFLHDTVEDKEVTHTELVKLFGLTIADATLKMSKVVNGYRIPDGQYYDLLPTCPIASVAKGFDRVHNLMSMLGAFSVDKRISYIEETMDKVVPMLKSARRSFPEQYSVYENIKFVMTNQVQLYIALNEHATQTHN